VTRYTKREATITVWCGADIAVTWRSADHFIAILQAFRAQFTTAHYDGYTKEWMLAKGWAAQVRHWVDATFESDAVTWQDEAPAPDDLSYIANAYQALYLVSDAPVWAVEAIYKAAMKVCHPDMGGDTASATRINNAIDTIRAYNARRH